MPLRFAKGEQKLNAILAPIRRHGLSRICGIVSQCVVQMPLAAFAVLAAGEAACAEDHPSRPISVVVPTGAGGAADISARLAAEALGRVLDTPVFVENRRNGLSAIVPRNGGRSSRRWASAWTRAALGG